MLKNILIASALSFSLANSQGQTEERKTSPSVIEKTWSSISHLMDSRSLAEKEFIDYLWGDYLPKITSGEDKVPILDTIHTNWRQFSHLFQTDFIKLLISSLIHRWVIEPFYRDLAIKNIKTMFIGTTRTFIIEFDKKDEKWENFVLSSSYEYSWDVIITREMQKIFDSIWFIHDETAGVLEFWDTPIYVNVLWDGGVPKSIEENYATNTPIHDIVLRWVKTIQITHNKNDSLVVLTLSYKDSKKYTQISWTVKSHGSLV